MSPSSRRPHRAQEPKQRNSLQSEYVVKVMILFAKGLPQYKSQQIDAGSQQLEELTPYSDTFLPDLSQQKYILRVC